MQRESQDRNKSMRSIAEAVILTEESEAGSTPEAKPEETGSRKVAISPVL